MKSGRTAIYALAGAIALAAAGGVLATRSSSEGLSVPELATKTHFHGLAVDPKDASRLYLATHHGLFVVDSAGEAQLISEARDDFMGFTPHPSDPTVLYASGHPINGGNLGILKSTDGGRSWTKIADGSGGPVDFHQMAVSKSDPVVIYGVYGDLQKSTDGGKSWSVVGPVPEGVIDIAVGSDPDRLYAATEQGLAISRDGGKSWEPSEAIREPITMVDVTHDSQVYAYIVGKGLMAWREGEEPQAQVVTDALGGGYVLHLAAAPSDPQRLYASTLDPQTRSQSLLTSSDGGRTWKALGGPR